MKKERKINQNPTISIKEMDFIIQILQNELCDLEEYDTVNSESYKWKDKLHIKLRKTRTNLKKKGNETYEIK